MTTSTGRLRWCTTTTTTEPLGVLDDDRLRLVFTCCHPALAMEARVALTLRMVGGLTVPEIARAFLVQESAMARRLTRAKAKIAVARIPYRVPTAEDLPARVSGVLAVLFLVFNEGYLASGADTDPIRHDLTGEAIRLTRMVRDLLPEDGEVAGLLALMLLTDARRTARVSPGGELVPLDEQDRSVWDRALVAEGHRLVRERLDCGGGSGSLPGHGRHQRRAHLGSHHARHRLVTGRRPLRPAATIWNPSPVVALNRAVALAELDGPQVALAVVEPLGEPLSGYHAYHAVRADLLRRVGRERGGAGGVHPGDRAGGQHGRVGLLDASPRRAGLGPATVPEGLDHLRQSPLAGLRRSWPRTRRGHAPSACWRTEPSRRP